MIARHVLWLKMCNKKSIRVTDLNLLIKCFYNTHKGQCNTSHHERQVSVTKARSSEKSRESACALPLLCPVAGTRGGAGTNGIVDLTSSVLSNPLDDAEIAATLLSSALRQYQDNAN